MSSQSPAGPPSETPSAPTHEKTTTPPGTPSPRPEMMFGLWTSWVESISKLASDMKTAPEGLPGQAAWQMSPDQLTSGLKQLGDMAAKDSILASILRATDDALNANPLRQVIPVDWAEIARALRTIWLRTISRPESAMAAAADFNMRQGQASIDTWNEAWQRWCGLARPEPAASGGADKRFAAPEWQGNPIFRTLKELYLLASDWLLRQASEAEDLSPAERQHLEFHLRQFVDAMSPTLLLASNPVALRRAVETGGASLAEGMRNLMHDLKEGRLSMVDAEVFAPGRNLALSPGKVVYRNKLIELIQYEPKTETVHRVPLLILPPWINKYYILDLQPKNSMVRHLVEQGFTVFMVSWRNPDTSMEGTTIEDYVDLGPLAASDVVREITGSPTVNVMGYCIGGTLLAMTLAWLAAKGDERFGAVTFMVSLQDFSKVGDTAVFLGEPTVDFIEQQMMERGYLDSRELSNMFSLLRSNDLIWAVSGHRGLRRRQPTSSSAGAVSGRTGRAGPCQNLWRAGAARCNCIGRGNGAPAFWPVISTGNSNSIFSLRRACPIRAKARAGSTLCRRLVCYRLIDPGREWRLHRQWFDRARWAISSARIIRWSRRMRSTAASISSSSTKTHCFFICGSRICSPLPSTCCSMI